MPAAVQTLVQDFGGPLTLRYIAGSADGDAGAGCTINQRDSEALLC